MKRIITATIVLCVLPVLVPAQTTVSGEFRPRAEYRHGFKTLMGDDDQAAFQISQRSRLNLEHKSDRFKAGLSVQEVRLWGETPQLGASGSRVMMHQAWAEWTFADGFSVKAGRQELNYDDARILGNVEWAQQARAHDLALFKYEKNFKLHAGIAFNQAADLLKGTLYNMPGSYKAMQFLWYNRKIGKLGLSALFLNNGLEQIKNSGSGVQEYKTIYNQTAGARLTYNEKKLSLQGNFYYTGGKDVTERKLSAINYLAGADYKISNRLTGTLGFEHLSGTSMKGVAADPTGYTNKSFNPFYGTNHKFNGFMDFFYVGNHLNSVGLNNTYFGLTSREGNATFNLTAHLFSAAADVIKSVGAETMPASLGTEFDFSLNYKINDQANIQAGYSHLFATETLQQLRGGNRENTTNWAWLMLTYKPVFLKN